jgi:hypothetical protein
VRTARLAPGGEKKLIGRVILVAIAALLLAGEVVRNAIVAQYADTQPQVAARAWPGHPEVELWQGLTEIGTASRLRRPMSPRTLSMIMNASTKAPLAPEPFLVRGIQAQLDGNEALAGEAFLAAKLRNGRSVPARYFLAEHAFRTGNARQGLTEIAFLSKFVPNGAVSLAPYLAAYAKDRRNWAQIRALFRSDPTVADAALSALAADPSNADLIQSIADVRSAPKTATWTGRLVASLIAAGDYSRAHDVWKRASHVERIADAPIFDPHFKGSDALAPFNWTLTSSTAGLAERRRGGGLHVIFYGQEDGVLASQLLLLRPGAYSLAMRVSGDVAHGSALRWLVTCASNKNPLLELDLAKAAAAAGGVEFVVPESCPAQSLELSGKTQDVAQQADITITGLRLERRGG